MRKKLLTLLLAVAMVFVMGVPAFATATDNTHTVTIYMQEATRNVADVVTRTSPLNSGNAVVVTVNDGQTLKNAIDKASAIDGNPFNSVVWQGDNSQFLKSMSVNGQLYSNIDRYYENKPEPGKTTYKGKSWMYFDGAPASMPASSYTYPNVSLGDRLVNGDMVITLSYEALTFIW